MPTDRSSRRSLSRAKRTVGAFQQPPWRVMENPYRPLEVLSQDQIEAIHHASLKLLSEMGIEFMSTEALEILEKAGADVDHSTQIVRFDPALITESIAKAPSTFTLHARNKERSLPFGGRSVVHSLVSSSPNVSCLDKGRRPGSFEDQCNMIKLQQMLNVIHMGGIVPVEALDLPVHTRNLDLLRANLTLSDKAFMCRAIGRERVIDALEMAAMAFGMKREDLIGTPITMTNVNINSPRRMDVELTTGAMEMMDHGQPVVVTPFTLLGAMAPVTIAGALTQQNAEALSVLAFCQIYKPSTPVVYGGFTSNVDMKSGAPAFGTPEYAKAVIASGQLIRRYGLPYRASNVNASNAVDAQAAYESQMSLWACMTGGVNFWYHGAGWMEGGLTSSYEKIILDAEMLQMMDEVMVPVEVNDDTIALDAIDDVGIAGHFFGTQHTIDRYETAFYQPLISDWRNYESWEEAGSPTADQRANRVWKQLLDMYEQPTMAPDRAEAIDAYVAKRKEEIGEGSW